MKKINDALVIIVGVLLFLLSYKIDYQARSLLQELRFPLIDLIFNFITNFWFIVLVMFLVPMFIVYSKNNKIAYYFMFTFIASIILAFVIKLIVLRPRPVEAFAYPFTSIINYSFPSMHAMIVFSLLPLLVKHLQKQKYFWVIFAVLVALSRVYLGFHFLSDVVFGAFFGYFLGAFLLELHEKKKLWK